MRKTRRGAFVPDPASLVLPAAAAAAVPVVVVEIGMILLVTEVQEVVVEHHQFMELVALAEHKV